MAKITTLLLFLLSLTSANALIEQMIVSSSDSRSSIPIGGKLTVKFHNDIPQSDFTFVLLSSRNSYNPLSVNETEFCTGHHPGLIKAKERFSVTFSNAKVSTNSSDITAVTTAGDGHHTDNTENYLPAGYYFLYMLHCDNNTRRGLTLDWDAHNVYFDDIKIYLPLGRTPIPLVDVVFTCLWLVFAVSWIIRLTKTKATRNAVHYAIATFLAFSVVALLIDVITHVTMASNGTKDGPGIIYATFSSLRSVMFFTIATLLCTGVKVIKEHLGKWDITIISVVLSLQLIHGATTVVCEVLPKTAERRIGFLMVAKFTQIITRFCLLTAATHTLNAVRRKRVAQKRRAQQNPEEDTCDSNFSKIITFLQNMYLLVSAYVYLSLTMTYLIDTYVRYEDEWTSDFVSEQLDILFFAFACYLLRPETGYNAVNDKQGLGSSMFIELDSQSQDDAEDVALPRSAKADAPQEDTANLSTPDSPSQELTEIII